jgi:hypothetical protein
MVISLNCLCGVGLSLLPRCVLELHAIASKKENGGARFAVAMTAKENKRFLQSIEQDEDQSLYYGMLNRVNAETSECSRASDRESIHEGIRRSVGFAKLGRMVFGVLEEWMEGQLREQVNTSLAAGDQLAAMCWKTNLANVLSGQGRFQEAADINEDIMKCYRRVLPSNSPLLGTFYSGFSHSVLIQIVCIMLFVSGDAMNNLAVQYSNLGRIQDAVVLQEETLLLRQRLFEQIPEYQPLIGTVLFVLRHIRVDIFRRRSSNDESCQQLFRAWAA